LSGSFHAKFTRNIVDIESDATLWSRQGLRSRARHALLSFAGSLPRPTERTFLRCLYLHYVYDDQVTTFRRLLSRLQRIGTFVSTERVRAIVTGREPLDARYFHLSFDDGFDNVHRNAFPVMADLGVPATVFVPTRFIGLPDDAVPGMWWDTGRPMNRPLDWDAVREMHEHGVDIGAHTRHHARLSDLSLEPEKLRDELDGAKQDLESKLGSPCRYMSWPFGTGSDVDDVGLKAIEAAGFDMCFSAIRGKVEPGRTSAFTVPRHHFEPEWPWSHIRYFASGGKE